MPKLDSAVEAKVWRRLSGPCLGLGIIRHVGVADLIYTSNTPVGR